MGCQKTVTFEEQNKSKEDIIKQFGDLSFDNNQFFSTLLL